MLGALLIALVSFFACNSDKDNCADVNCGANGFCDNGKCVCDKGFEGTSCATEIRQKYLGSWKVKEVPCVYDSCGRINTINCPDFNLTISEDPALKYKFIVKNFGNYGSNVQVGASVTGSTDFVLDTTTVGTSNPKAVFVGNGYFDNAKNRVIIRYTVTQGCEKTTAVDTLSK